MDGADFTSGIRSSTLVVGDAAWMAMVRHAEEEYPDECCGVLLSDTERDGRLVKAAVACLNRSEKPRNRSFLIDPQELLEVRQQARTAGMDVVGFYHSHPDRGAYFSESDILNCWPRFVNIVLSIEKGRVREAKAFRVDQGHSRADELLLILAASAQ